MQKVTTESGSVYFVDDEAQTVTRISNSPLWDHNAGRFCHKMYIKRQWTQLSLGVGSPMVIRFVNGDPLRTTTVVKVEVINGEK